MKNNFTRIITACAAALLIKILVKTWRVRFFGPDPNAVKGPFIFCFFHGNQAGLLAHPRVRPAVVMTSFSTDGELQNFILNRLGFHTVRGSSSRKGASGLKGIIRNIREGKDALFAVDGPRGPRGQVKAGALAAAKLTHTSLVPIAFSTDRAWIFERSWDRYTLPKPFAKVNIFRGNPIEAVTPLPFLEKHIQLTLHSFLKDFALK